MSGVSPARETLDRGPCHCGSAEHAATECPDNAPPPQTTRGMTVRTLIEQLRAEDPNAPVRLLIHSRAGSMESTDVHTVNAPNGPDFVNVIGEET